LGNQINRTWNLAHGKRVNCGQPRTSEQPSFFVPAAMQRTLQPELLDSLPPDHPDALHNRRDLLAINALMGNHRWFARTLPRLMRVDEHALEIGAGTGELSVRLARLGISIAGLDVWPEPANWPESRAWHRADLRTFSEYARYGVIFGNMIFHQFTEHELAHLGAALRPTARMILACEPTRRSRSRVLYRAVAPLLGANYVSLHDADVSITSGFVGDELPRALGLVNSPPPLTVEADRVENTWDVTCSETMLGAYRMIAIRRP
jgi:hypothetical protein